jgi:uncharacterized protein
VVVKNKYHLNDNQSSRGGLIQLFVFLLVCLGIAAIFSPWIYMGVQSLAQSSDAAWIKYLAKHPFHRYFNRVLQISMILGFWKIFKGTGFASMNALGLRGKNKRKDFVLGTVMSLLCLALYAIGLFALDIYSMKEEISQSFVRIVSGIIFTALAVSFLEELFFRGFLYQLCRREWGIQKALIFNCLFFAVVHFLKPLPSAMKEVDYLSGFKLLGLAFYQFSSTEFIPYFVLLVLLAAMLCWSLERTKNLWLAIGIHAGLILGIQLFGEITRYKSALPQWYFGGGDIKQGVAALIPLGIQFVVLYFWLNRSGSKKSP